MPGKFNKSSITAKIESSLSSPLSTSKKKKIFTYTQIETLNNMGLAVKQDQSNFQHID